MIDRAPTAPAIPDFAPVPRRHNRQDGWTPERQRAFIEALADTGSVKHAAKRVNMASEGAYALRRAPGAEGFVAAWDAALDHGVQRLADLAIDRAIEGVPVPIMYRGEQVGERRQYNDRLLTWSLRHHQPGRYGPDGRRDGLTPRERVEAERLRQIEEARESADGMDEFARRIDEMAFRMAAHDPKIDISGGSCAERLTYVMFRLWPRKAVETMHAYMDEVDPEGAAMMAAWKKGKGAG